MEKNVPPPPPPVGFVTGPSFIQPPPPPPYNDGQPSFVVIGNTQFGSESQRVRCTSCHADISTSVETAANMKTHMIALLLCVFGFWCCVPCPYCMDSCLVKKHYCPACKAYLGQSTN